MTGQAASEHTSTLSLGLSPEALLEAMDAHDEGVVGYVLAGLKEIPYLADAACSNREQILRLGKNISRLDWVLQHHALLQGSGDDQLHRFRDRFHAELPGLLEWVALLAAGKGYAVAHIALAGRQLYEAGRPVLLSFRS